MNDIFLHSLIEQERAERRAKDIRAILLGLLVVGMFAFGVLVGWMLPRLSN